MLRMTRDVRDRLVAHCLWAQPYEGCGLLVGSATEDAVIDAVGTRNVAQSALVYEIDADEHLRIDRRAQAEGLDVIGAFHSHTHTDAWPSATDVAAAVDPSWHWVIVSLRSASPVLRSFLVVDNEAHEEAVLLL